MSFSRPMLPKGFKIRSHHNNTGLRQVKKGRATKDLKRIATRLGLPFHIKPPGSKSW